MTELAPKKQCILEDNKLCDGCCDCNTCELDPFKVCDNCAKCLENVDYNGVKIDRIEFFEEDGEK